MGRILTAFRAFFAALINRAKCERIQQVLAGGELPKITRDEKSKPADKVVAVSELPPKRSDALTLLSTLQQEARLIDLIQEPLESYTDEQVGGAARNVLRDAAAVLQRLVGLQAVLGQDEGSLIDVSVGYDPARFRLTGNVEGKGPFHGKLAHKGWLATSINLPTWNGSKESALVIAPAEVEV